MNEQENLAPMNPSVDIPNYLWQSIVVTILCCWPLGIPAIIFAAKVNGLVTEGKIEEARQASGQAKMWCWISLGLGLVTIVVSVLFQVLAVFGMAAAEGY